MSTKLVTALLKVDDAAGISTPELTATICDTAFSSTIPTVSATTGMPEPPSRFLPASIYVGSGSSKSLTMRMTAGSASTALPTNVAQTSLRLDALSIAVVSPFTVGATHAFGSTVPARPMTWISKGCCVATPVSAVARLCSNAWRAAADGQKFVMLPLASYAMSTRGGWAGVRFATIVTDTGAPSSVTTRSGATRPSTEFPAESVIERSTSMVGNVVATTLASIFATLLTAAACALASSPTSGASGSAALEEEAVTSSPSIVKGAPIAPRSVFIEGTPPSRRAVVTDCIDRGKRSFA